MSLKFDFSAKRVVVTGGAQGLGLAIARDFLTAGADVAIWDCSEAAIAAGRKELAAFGARVTWQRVDVGDQAGVDAAAAALPFRLDILVNNAGITRDKSFAKLSVEDFEAVVRTNLTGAFLVTKALLGRFDAQNSNKRIVNMASFVALYGNFGQTNYAAAKAGLIAMTKSLSRELGRKGFTVNALAPGFISTPMTAAMPADVLSSMGARVPVGRLGKEGDVAQACLFLAADESSYINGAVLSVDGGLVI